MLTLAMIAVTATPVAWESCRLDAGRAFPTVSARCGRVSVPMDPRLRDGSELELFVAKIPALRASPEPDPLVLIAGGPGQSAAEMAVLMQAALAPVLLTRDVIAIDQRGTGRSAPLKCEAADESAALDGAQPRAVREATRRCLESLPYDPRLFTTSVAVRDLDAVRAALEVERWNLYGVSYGTRVALHYLRRYPERARAAVLDGVVNESRILGPDIALRSQETLDAVFERCRRSSPCRAALGDPSAKLRTLLERLGRGAVPVALVDPVTGVPENAEFSLDNLRVALRLFAYRSETQAMIPLLIQQAADQKNYAPLAIQARSIVEELGRQFAIGMQNSVTCSEDVPAIVDSAALRESLGRTYLGADTLQALLAACEVWPQGFVDDDLREPVRADVPVLALSGELDPITPPGDVDGLMTRLARGRHIVVPGAGHGVMASGCLPRLVDEFLDTGDAKALETGCVDRLKAFPFAVDANGPTP